MTQLPHWDVSNVYPGLDSPELEAAIAAVGAQIDALDRLIDAAPALDAPAPALAAQVAAAVDQVNAAVDLAETIRSYIAAFVTTDSRNALAKKKLSEFEQVMVREQQVATRLQAWIGRLAPRLEELLPLHPTCQAHAFALREMAEQARYMMSEAEEALAAELNLSGANAWGKLQGTVTSQLSVDFELDGALQSLPMPALINLRTHADEAVRHRAYDAENKAWDSVREPLAAALNGVKGAANTLDRRRGRTDALHAPLDTARMDRATLQAMLDAMAASFPAFRRYFAAKARRLGKEKLAWWDLFAPLGKTEQRYSWQETQSFIVENFATFSEDLAELATRAFDQNWIDAEQRTGKRGGAFCMGLPTVKESRILTNFDGSLDQISTVAHELGHAFHNECAFQANKTMLQTQTPMTLAETASIMCETIVTEAVLARATDPDEELAILENMLSGQAQVIVDIYSRYLFEQEVFVRRAQSELTADELCDIMRRAQEATYGEGLDSRYLQPYMWTWKPHYYSSYLSFYNFPYAFGLLFATGLYAIYQQRGADFVDDYRALLAATGEAPAAELAARFGIDLRSQQFWADSLAVIERRIDRYCAI
jgi:pepF/M3 family oligoendopeptidase